MPGEATPYDQVLYPGFPFRDAHPDHLNVLGTMLGMEPTPVRRCRVLELGCGGAQWTCALRQQSVEVVGLDVSSRQLAAARAGETPPAAVARRRERLVDASAAALRGERQPVGGPAATASVD